MKSAFKVVSCLILIQSVFASSVYAQAEKKCEKTIYFIPQTHAPNAAGLTETERQTKLEDTAASQYKIARFIENSDRTTPVFQEGLFGRISDPSGGIDKTSEERTTIYELRKAFAAGKTIQDLTPKQKEILVLKTATISELLLGKKPVIYGTSPSLAEHEANQADQKAFFAQGMPLRMDDEKNVDLIFRVREKWALNEIMKYFKERPQTNAAILVFGSLHNFPEYAKLMPGVCIEIPEDFKSEVHFPRYSINANGLMQLLVSNSASAAAPQASESSGGTP